MHFPTDLTSRQKLIIQSSLSDYLPVLKKYDLFEILNGIFYVMKTGCQWNMLPLCYPSWRMVYHHFRSWSDRGWFKKLLDLLIQGKRCADGATMNAQCAVIDSQSVRSALPQSEKGIDGYKRIKGVKRHIITDLNGFVLGVSVTKANASDAKSAYPLIGSTMASNPDMKTIKADKGYQGALKDILRDNCDIELECVKSNYGTSEFIPTAGRWVVERTFSWMDNYRRLTRNYEKLLKVARHIFITACAMFMLRYF